MGEFNRRDFLKIAALVSAAAYFPRTLSVMGGSNSDNPPNLMVIVFDAMSARNLSVYGYPRKTTPNLERFAQRAFVYHAHASAGNFTIPGTASLLTGMYPWTHRAINHAGQVSADMVDRNIFELLGNGFNRYAFGQNAWADILLNQFDADIDHHLPIRSFGAKSYWLTSDAINDTALGYQTINQFLFSKSSPPGSLLFGLGERLYGFDKYRNVKSKDYPNGLPHVVTAQFFYRLDSLFDGLQSACVEFQPPYFSYLHLHPPHEPYRPTRDYFKHFIDDYNPLGKPVHPLANSLDSEERLGTGRLNYDRFIANLDAEFGRLLDTLESAGVLENTCVILTSDHGELFERGVRGHSTPLLYDSILHVPLLISVPGKRDRTDIHSPTNSVDILPTLLHLAGREIPVWCDGKVLPGLGGVPDVDRSTFSMDAKENSAFAPIRTGTIAMQKGEHKMIYYTGYEPEDAFELYNLVEDPEEMNDLYADGGTLSKSLAEELMDRLQAANSRSS